MSKEAQAADERTDADAEVQDPAFGDGFDEAANAKDEGEDAPLVVKEKEPPAAEKPPEPPPATEDKPPAAEKPPEPPPPAPELTAAEKAEAEGAKLKDPDEPPATPAPTEGSKSVLEVLSTMEGYKDAGEVLKTDSFRTWFEKQPAHVQNLGTSGGVDGACAVLDFYRSAAARTAQAAASAPPAAGAKRLLADLGDMEMVQADGTKIKVQDYLKDMGDVGEAIAVIADRLAGKRMEGVKPGVTPDAVSALQNEVARLQFWDAVSTEHSDARKVVKSEAFKKWVPTASPAIQRLVRSGDPSHAVLALDAFKEAQVKAAKDADLAQGGKNKSRKIALHGDTARGQTVAANKKPDDFDDGFEEGASK
jgi:hypothetical protein